MEKDGGRRVFLIIKFYSSVLLPYYLTICFCCSFNLEQNLFLTSSPKSLPIILGSAQLSLCYLFFLHTNPFLSEEGDMETKGIVTQSSVSVLL